MSDEHGVDELLGFATEALRLCGGKALGLYGRGAETVKFDEGLVIDAGLQLTEFFRDQLYSRYPGHRVYSNQEEQERDYRHDGTRYLWVYDPLDGVANFQAGIPIWGSSLALLENYWPVLGAFYMPATGDLFYAKAGDRAHLGDHPIKVSAQDAVDDESVLLTYSRFHQHYATRFPGKIRSLGCTGAHVCYVATGRAEGALINNLSFEELGAVRVILESAGGGIFRMDGTEFFLNEYLDSAMIREDLLAAPPELGRQILETIERLE